MGVECILTLVISSSPSFRYGMWYLSFSHIVSLRYALSLFLRMAPTLPVLKWLVTRCKLSRWKIMEMSAWVTWRCRYKIWETVPPTQQQSFFRNLHSLLICKTFPGVSTKANYWWRFNIPSDWTWARKTGSSTRGRGFLPNFLENKLVFQEPKLDESNPDRKVVFLGKFTC